MQARPGSPTSRLAAIGADLALVVVSLSVRWAAPLAPCDDAFIVLAAARSALSASGWHLLPDGSDAVLTTLIWPALVAIPLAFGWPPELALGLVGGASEIALALVVRRLAQRASGSLSAGTFVAALMITHPVLRLSSQGGMETALYLALGAGAALALPRRAAGRLDDGKPAVLSLGAGALPWLRFDGFLPAAVLFAAGAWVWRGRSEARRWLVGGALLAALAPVGDRILLGTWVPATIPAKAIHGGAASLAGAAAVALEFGRAAAGMSAYWLVSPSAHLALVPLAIWGGFRWRRRHEIDAASIAILLWSLLHVAALVSAGRAYATNFPWYFVPPLLGLAVLAAYGAAPIADRLGEARLGRWSVAMPPAIVAAVFLATIPSLSAGFDRVRASFTAHRERAYAAAAIWLGRSGPAASVASNEIGTLAWHSPPGTEIIDLFGIARRSPELQLHWLELVRRRRPEAVITRMDFRYRRELEAALPGEYLWARLGAVDLGLRADRAAHYEQFQEQLPRIYLELDLGRGAPPRPAYLQPSNGTARHSPPTAP